MASSERDMYGRRAIAMLILGIGCRPSLGPATIEGHPALALDRARPSVVDSNRSAPPAWIATSSTSGERYAMIGQASAASLEAADAAAQRDLLRAIAELVAVEVEYEHETISEHRDGEEHESTTDESRSRADQGAVIARGTKIADRYWEKVAVGSRPAIYRSYALAFVDRPLIEAARLERFLEAERGRGRRVILLDDLAGEDALIAGAISAELRRRILAAPRASIVRRLPAPLRPDLEIGGTVTVRGSAIEVRYVIEGVLPLERTLRGTRAELFELEDRLAEAITADLEAR